ncbi:MAG TPA: hypothetical protein EYG91_00920 [Aquifex aeolicus]|nr:hypothetical protein [Aquifex aeolicus]
MNNLNLLFLSSIMACSGPLKIVNIEKPTPCHFVKEIKREGNVVMVYLERERGKICSQVVVKDKIRVEKDVEKVKIMVDNRVWKEYKIMEGSK